MKRMKPDTEILWRLTASGKVKVYINTLTRQIRRRGWTKARVPGTIRASRLPGGSGFRNNWEKETCDTF